MSGARKESNSNGNSFMRIGSSKSMKGLQRINTSGPMSPVDSGTPKSQKFPAPFSSSQSVMGQNGGFSDALMTPGGTGFDSAKHPNPKMARTNRSASMIALTTGFAILGCVNNTNFRSSIRTMHHLFSLQFIFISYSPLLLCMHACRSDLHKKCDVGVQVDEKDEFGCGSIFV